MMRVIPWLRCDQRKVDHLIAFSHDADEHQHAIMAMIDRSI